MVTGVFQSKSQGTYLGRAGRASCPKLGCPAPLVEGVRVFSDSWAIELQTEVRGGVEGEFIKHLHQPGPCFLGLLHFAFLA